VQGARESVSWPKRLTAWPATSRIRRAVEAGRRNHDLFLGSIRMLAAAIDEKDPYTRAILDAWRICRDRRPAIGLPAPELDKIRISALLHDVVRSAWTTRSEKTAKLTPEEFG